MTRERGAVAQRLRGAAALLQLLLLLLLLLLLDGLALAIRLTLAGELAAAARQVEQLEQCDDGRAQPQPDRAAQVRVKLNVLWMQQINER